jgi:hypothetical protein
MKTVGYFTVPVLETPPGLRGQAGRVVPAGSVVSSSGQNLLAKPVPIPEDPRIFLERWAAAWTAQDLETYLASYAENFSPADGVSRSAWEQQRRVRLQNPAFIQVELKDLVVKPLADNRVKVELEQSYRSDLYTDRGRKEFELEQKAGRWFILQEKVIGASQ